MINDRPRVPPSDPSEWGLSGASITIGVDLGFSADHSAMAVASCHHSNDAQMIGIRELVEFPLQTPHEELARAIVETALRYGNPRIVVDASNNGAFLSLLASRFGNSAPNHIIACTISGAQEHGLTPQPYPLVLFGQKTNLHKWPLSRNALLVDLAAEMENSTVKITATGDYEKLRTQLMAITQEQRASGRIVYNSSGAAHDDLIIATAMSVWCARRLGQPPRRMNRQRQEKFSSRGWT